MKKIHFAIPLIALSAGAAVLAQNIGKPTPLPPATSSRPHDSYVSKLTATRPGETVLTFPNADVGHPLAKYTQQGVTFELASRPRQTQAEPRVMFFPHQFTDHNGILNAMANEQAIPVKVTLPQTASSVTLVLWGSTDTYALVEAHAADGKLLDSASIEKAPSRLDPADPMPSFELTVKGEKIAYVLFGGAANGMYVAAEEIRFMPDAAGVTTATKPASVPATAAGQ